MKVCKVKMEIFTVMMWGDHIHYSCLHNSWVVTPAARTFKHEVTSIEHDQGKIFI